MTFARALSLAVVAASLVLTGCKRSISSMAEPAPAATNAPTLAAKFKDHNLVFVSFDALQAAHVGCLGNLRNVTPALDSMAKDGFLFTKAYSVASWTVPASMTWFTGVFPSEHRMTNKFAVFSQQEQKFASLKDLSPNLVTLAEILKLNGYATGGFTGNAGVSGGFGYDRGFDRYFFERQRFGSLDESIPRALEWLKENGDKKFFLFLHGYDIHGQNTPAGGFDHRFVDKDYDGKYTGSEQEQEMLREEGLDKGRLSLRDADIRFWRAVYDEKIQRTDAKFKRFLEEFDKLGLTGKTLFVLTSDHGTEFCEHGRFDHGFTLYNEQIQVPLIVKTPRGAGGKVITERVSSVDVMPTILDLLDVHVPADARLQLRGQSLISAMNGERVVRDLFSETDYRLFTYKRAIVAPDGWKLILTLEDNSRELYDLNRDSGETKNLANAERNRADELQQRLFAHFKAIGHDLTKKRWERGFNPVYDFPAREPPKK